MNKMALYWFKAELKKGHVWCYIGTSERRIEKMRQQKIMEGIPVSELRQNLGLTTMIRSIW